MGEERASPLRATVTSMDEARAAIRKAASLGVIAELDSPENGAQIFGVLWFSEMQKVLRKEFPGVEFRLTLDCADRSDLAHAALVEGLRSIRLSGQTMAVAAIKNIAKELGAEVKAGD